MSVTDIKAEELRQKGGTAGYAKLHARRFA